MVREEKTGSISLDDMIRVLFRREFYLDIAVFVLVCIPAVLVVLLLCLDADRRLRLEPFIQAPYNALAFMLLSASGAFVVWHAYSYLVLIGEGSPCPQLGGTRKLVTCGPYALVRHPSVVGKLLGIIGLGCLSGSVSFTFFIIPLLFLWSVFYNRYIQEKGCEEKFGEEYREYRKKTPMFFPLLAKGRR